MLLGGWQSSKLKMYGLMGLVGLAFLQCKSHGAWENQEQCYMFIMVSATLRWSRH